MTGSVHSGCVKAIFTSSFSTMSHLLLIDGYSSGPALEMLPLS